MDVLQNTNEADYSYTSKELDEWFGLGSPTFVFATLLVYLLLIYKIVPYYMKDREPYQLKSYIVVYNTIQMLSCIYIITGILRITSTNVFRFWECSILDSNTYIEYLFNRVTYFTFWLKISELSETIVFVLRKKQNQVSYLHVFHHCSTITLFYLLLTSLRGGLSTLYPILLNSIVHVIMYAYYLAAAVCDAETIKRLTPIKKSITTIQMIQFVMILTQAGFLVRCGISMLFTTYYAIVVVVIFYGFYDFYKKSYQANNSRTSNKSS